MPVLCCDCDAECYKRLGDGEYEGWVIWVCSQCGEVVKKVRAGATSPDLRKLGKR